MLRKRAHVNHYTSRNRVRGARCAERAVLEETCGLLHFCPRRRIDSCGYAVFFLVSFFIIHCLHRQQKISAKHCATNAQLTDLLKNVTGIRDETAWKTRLLIEFRLLRKRALQQAIDKLRTMPEVERNEL